MTSSTRLSWPVLLASLLAMVVSLMLGSPHAAAQQDPPTPSPFFDLSEVDAEVQQLLSAVESLRQLPPIALEALLAEQPELRGLLGDGGQLDLASLLARPEAVAAMIGLDGGVSADLRADHPDLDALIATIDLSGLSALSRLAGSPATQGDSGGFGEVEPDAAEEGAPALDAELVAVQRFETEGRIDLAITVLGVAPGETPIVGVEDGTAVDDLRVEALDEAPTVVLIVDTSGSMAGERLADAQQAAVRCIDEMPRNAAVGIVAYAEGPPTIVSPQLDREAVLRTVEELVAQGETATFDAVVSATQLLRHTSSSLDRASRFLVLLSDGEDTVSERTPADAVEAMDGAGFQLFALGIQPEGDFFPSLEALTSGAAGTLVLGGPEDLAPLCASVAERIDGRYGLSLEFDELPAEPFGVSLGFQNGSATVEVPAPADVGPEGAGASSGTGGPSGDDGAPDDQQDEPAPTAPGTDESVDIEAEAAAPADPPAPPPAPEPPLQQPEADPAAASRSVPSEVTWRLWVGAASLAISPMVLIALMVRGRGIQHGLRLRRTHTGAMARVSAFVGRLLERNRLNRGLERRLEIAAIKLRPGEFVTFVALGSVASAIGLNVAGLRLSSLLSLVVVPLVAWIWLRRRCNARTSLFQAQLGDTLMLLAGALRSGHSTMQALATAAEKAPSPNAEEFQRVVAETRIGRDVVASLHDMAERMGSEDAAWVVEAIALNRELGGNLSTTLDNVAATMRDRAQVQSQVKVMSAEGRLTATILLGLPFAVALVLQFLNPGYLGALFTTGGGNVILAAAGGLMVVGGFWVSRLVKLEY